MKKLILALCLLSSTAGADWFRNESYCLDKGYIGAELDKRIFEVKTRIQQARDAVNHYKELDNKVYILKLLEFREETQNRINEYFDLKSNISQTCSFDKKAELLAEAKTSIINSGDLDGINKKNFLNGGATKPPALERLVEISEKQLDLANRELEILATRLVRMATQPKRVSHSGGER